MNVQDSKYFQNLPIIKTKHSIGPYMAYYLEVNILKIIHGFWVS